MSFFKPNLEARGRVVRGVAAIAMLVGGAVLWRYQVWASIILLVSGVFVLFESLKGWCVLRACGIKTKL